MSQYVPKPSHLRVVEQSDGFYVHDQYGLLDGPYSRRDAIAVVNCERQAWEVGIVPWYCFALDLMERQR